jgi:hypothetical protein
MAASSVQAAEDRDRCEVKVVTATEICDVTVTESETRSTEKTENVSETLTLTET